MGLIPAQASSSQTPPPRKQSAQPHRGSDSSCPPTSLVAEYHSPTPARFKHRTPPMAGALRPFPPTAASKPVAGIEWEPSSAAAATFAARPCPVPGPLAGYETNPSLSSNAGYAQHVSPDIWTATNLGDATAAGRPLDTSGARGAFEYAPQHTSLLGMSPGDAPLEAPSQRPRQPPTCPNINSTPAPSASAISVQTQSQYAGLVWAPQSDVNNVNDMLIPSYSASTSLAAAPGLARSQRVHRKHTTKEEANYQCTVQGCGKFFSRSYNYKSHLETHDEQREYPFPCLVGGCTKRFVRKTDLQRHHQSVHVKERHHRCDYCGRLFARKDTLRRHMEDGCAKRFELKTLDLQSNLRAATIPVAVRVEQHAAECIDKESAWDSYHAQSPSQAW